MSAHRVTYFAEGYPRSRRTCGLIKIGSSGDPVKRARALSAHLIGASSLPEMWFRTALLPHCVSTDELKERGVRSGFLLREWYRDVPAVRMLLAWASEFNPALEAEPEPEPEPAHVRTKEATTA